MFRQACGADTVELKSAYMQIGEAWGVLAEERVSAPSSRLKADQATRLHH
jgi:hypothetical protein